MPYPALVVVCKMFRGLFLVAAIMGAVAPSYAQDLKVGYVDLGRIERESAQGKKIIATLKQEFAPREREILEFQARIKEQREQFERERITLSESQRAEKGKSIADMMKKSDRMVYAMRENAQLRRRQITGEFLREQKAAIEAVIKAENFDLVIQKAVFSSNRIDITDRVLAEMAKRAGAAGP